MSISSSLAQSQADTGNAPSFTIAGASEAQQFQDKLNELLQGHVSKYLEWSCHSPGVFNQIHYIAGHAGNAKVECLHQAIGFAIVDLAASARLTHGGYHVFEVKPGTVSLTTWTDGIARCIVLQLQVDHELQRRGVRIERDVLFGRVIGSRIREDQYRNVCAEEFNPFSLSDEQTSALDERMSKVPEGGDWHFQPVASEYGSELPPLESIMLDESGLQRTSCDIASVASGYAA